MSSKSYINAFDPEEKSEKVCQNCGICLHKCPVMSMEKDEAVAEHARLRSGEETMRVMNECTFCYNCNNYCPQGLNPMALIMERLSEKIQATVQETPSYITTMYTGPDKQSVFAKIYDSLPDNEKAVLKKWETPPPPADDVLFIGCIGREIPLSIDSSAVLSSLPKFAPRAACCGELPFRMGHFKIFQKTAETTLKMFEKLNAKRLICYCGSCANSYTQIWPKYLGMKLPFEVFSIWQWLWEKVQKGRLTVQRKLNKKVALADSCYASELGDGFMDAVRGLHEAVGIEVVELKNNRYDNKSCGMATLARNYNIMDSLTVAGAKIMQAKETGAKELSCYCPGCLMNLQGSAKGMEINAFYTLDEILWALGDNSPVKLYERTAQQSALFVQEIQKHMAKMQRK